MYVQRNVDRDSSVGIETRYGLDSPGIESRWGARFSAPVQTGPGAPQASYTMGTGSFPEVKRPGRGGDHPPQSRAEVKDGVDRYLYSPFGLSWTVLRWSLPLRIAWHWRAFRYLLPAPCSDGHGTQSTSHTTCYYQYINQQIHLIETRHAKYQSTCFGTGVPTSAGLLQQKKTKSHALNQTLHRPHCSEWNIKIKKKNN